MNSASLRPARPRRRAPRAVLVLAAAALAACGAADAETAATAVASSVATAATAAATNISVPGDSAREALLARADLGRIKGRETAPVWIIVISDFQCPFCKRWHDETAPRIERDYVRTGKVRMAYLNFPISTHRNAQPAHELAMCAAEQGNFWPVADKLFATMNDWKNRFNAVAYFDSLARTLPLEQERLNACIKGGDLRPLIEADYRRATRVGVGSTPTFFIGDKAIIGAQPYEAFAEAIDAALVAAAAAPSAPPAR
jgi:protein-disulfide isomerase